MALVLADRVEQVTRTTGLGDLQLAETIRGRQSFQEVTNNGDTVIYVLEDSEGVNWEIGEGTVVHGTETTLQRTTIRQSTNSDAKISLSAGTHRVFLVADAAYITDLTSSAELAQAIADHEAAADPHPQYTTTAEAAAAAPVQSVNGESGTVLLDATDVGATPASHVGTGGSQHADATTTVAGFMSGADKTKLDTVETNAKDDQSAAEVPYSNATSGLTATDVQAAVDELDGQVDTNTSNISTNASNISTNTTEIDKRTIYVGSVAESLSGLAGVAEQAYQVVAWHPGGAAMTSPKGGGEFVFKSDAPKSAHNGGTIISPTVPPVSSQSGANHKERRDNFLAGTGETDAAGTGVFVRQNTYGVGKVEAFGALADSGIDEIEPILSCIAATSGVAFDAGRYKVSIDVNLGDGQSAKGQGIDKTVIEAISPGDNGNFGGNSVIRATGAEGAPIYGVRVSGLTIDCGELFDSSGSVGLKGHTMTRVHGFSAKNIKVIDCRSYAYWAQDKTLGNGGFTFSSGTYTNCYAVDCNISFEQTNCRGVTLINCHASQTGRALPYGVPSMFHPYGGENLDITMVNCTGVGAASTIFDLLNACKHVRAFGCRFINSAANATAMFMTSTNSDFDNISMSDCYLEATSGTAAQLSIGVNGTSTNTISFSSCRFIGGDGKGAQINSNTGGGVFNFTDCETFGTTTAGTTPFGLFDNGGSATVKYVGGLCKAEGPDVGGSPTNVSASSFVGARLIPLTNALPAVRQRVVSSGTFTFNGSYGFFDVQFPAAIQGDLLVAENVTLEAVTTLHPRDADNAVSQGAARALSFAMRDNQTLRIYADNSTGVSVNCVITEWE